MIAGRETDVRVAMARGCRVSFDCRRMVEPQSVTGMSCESDYVPLPCYSTDRSAALTLLDGRWWEAHVSPTGKTEVKLCIAATIYTAVEPTLALAICAAFLAEKEAKP